VVSAAEWNLLKVNNFIGEAKDYAEAVAKVFVGSKLKTILYQTSESKETPKEMK
jgi:hypothetical protein